MAILDEKNAPVTKKSGTGYRQNGQNIVLVTTFFQTPITRRNSGPILEESDLRSEEVQILLDHFDKKWLGLGQI